MCGGTVTCSITVNSMKEKCDTVLEEQSVKLVGLLVQSLVDFQNE